MTATSQPNCQMLHRFYSRALDNFRTLYIYLPPSYAQSADRYYPVLYMHDGQNIFTGEFSYSGMGWEIHHTADELALSGAMEEIVIIGIANGGEDRLSEYAHFDGCTMGRDITGKGLLYERFVLEDVMPFVEANFRVLTGPQNTGLMGSSMGGLVTFMMGARHPEIFGKLGVVSPSFWWSPPALSRFFADLSAAQLPKKIWMDMGDGEGPLKEGFDVALDRLLTLKSKPAAEGVDLKVWIVPGGRHSEYDWQMRAHCPLLFLFGEVGTPEALELHAPEAVVQGENGHFLRPVLAYDSGFCRTPFEAVCWSSAPEILSLGWNLQLYGNAPGKAILYGAWGDLRSEWRTQVLPPPTALKTSSKSKRHRSGA